MNFVTVTAEELEKLREALVLIERVTGYDEDRLKLTLYGLTSDSGVIDATKEAIADEAELEETDIKIAGEVAVAIELSGDILYYLTGSGLKLQTEEVAFTKGGGNGVDSAQLSWAKWRPTVTVRSFREMALATDSWSAATFLQRYGKKGPAVTTPPAHPAQEVKRNIESAGTAPASGRNRAPGAVNNNEPVDPQLIKEFLD